MKEVFKTIRAVRRALAKYAKELPNLDANSSVNSLTLDMIEELDFYLKEMPPSLKEAKQLAKKFPRLLGKKRI